MSHRLVFMLEVGNPGGQNYAADIGKGWPQWVAQGIAPVLDYMKCEGFEPRSFVSFPRGFKDPDHMSLQTEAVENGATYYAAAWNAIGRTPITNCGYWASEHFDLAEFHYFAGEYLLAGDLCIDSLAPKLHAGALGYHEHTIRAIAERYHNRKVYAEGVPVKGADEEKFRDVPLFIRTDNPDLRRNDLYSLREHWRAEIMVWPVGIPGEKMFDVAKELISRGFTVAAPVAEWYSQSRGLGKLLA